MRVLQRPKVVGTLDVAQLPHDGKVFMKCLTVLLAVTLRLSTLLRSLSALHEGTRLGMVRKMAELSNS